MNKDNLKIAGALGLLVIAGGMTLSFIPTSSVRGNFIAIAILGGAVGYFITDYLTKPATRISIFGHNYTNTASNLILGTLTGAIIAIAIWSLTQSRLLKKAV